MTLQTTIASIDTLYPVAGIDNDSQGFRDNFGYIKTALTTVDSEITALQTNAVLSSNVINGDPVDNDLNGSSINNGSYNEFYGISFNSVTTSSTDIDVRSGSLQQFTLSSDVNFRFTNWPTSGKYAKVRVHLVGDSITSHTAIFSSQGGVVVLESNILNPITIDAVGKHLVFDAWCYTGSTDKIVYVSYVGEF